MISMRNDAGSTSEEHVTRFFEFGKPMPIRVF